MLALSGACAFSETSRSLLTRRGSTISPVTARAREQSYEARFVPTAKAVAAPRFDMCFPHEACRMAGVRAPKHHRLCLHWWLGADIPRCGWPVYGGEPIRCDQRGCHSEPTP